MKFWKIAEIVGRFIPIISVMTYGALRMSHGVKDFDIFVVLVLTALTLGFWGFADFKVKKTNA